MKMYLCNAGAHLGQQYPIPQVSRALDSERGLQSLSTKTPKRWSILDSGTANSCLVKTSVLCLFKIETMVKEVGCVQGMTLIHSLMISWAYSLQQPEEGPLLPKAFLWAGMVHARDSGFRWEKERCFHAAGALSTSTFRTMSLLLRPPDQCASGIFEHREPVSFSIRRFHSLSHLACTASNAHTGFTSGGGEFGLGGDALTGVSLGVAHACGRRVDAFSGQDEEGVEYCWGFDSELL